MQVKIEKYYPIDEDYPEKVGYKITIWIEDVKCIAINGIVIEGVNTLDISARELHINDKKEVILK